MKKQTLKLKAKHRWRARPGHRIFVADRGAVRFDFPDHWIMKMGTVSVSFHDAEPPADDCRLEVSFNRLPPADWDAFPLPRLLEEALACDPRPISSRGETVQLLRRGLRVAWTELGFTDPVEHREAFSRVLVGLGNNVQCLITFDYWADDAPRMTPAWDEVVRTLELGVHITDPTTGARRDPRLS